MLNKTCNPIFQIYPFSLTYAIFEDEERAMSIYVPGIEEVLYTIPDRERDVLLKRYKDGMTQKQIGESIGVSGNRVSQILHKAIRRLRHPSRCFSFMAISRKEHQNELSEVNKNLMILKNKNSSLLELLNKAGVISQDQIDIYKSDNWNINEIKNIPIDDLELSVRSYNCLKRADINTLFDLTLLREEDLANIRNMGRKSAEEIISKANEYGVKLSNEFDENDIRNLNISFIIKTKLLKDQIYDIDKLTDLTVDDIINLEYDYRDINDITSALAEIEKTFKLNIEVSNMSISDDLKEILLEKGFITINQILEIYDADWKEIIGDHFIELANYMHVRGTPLKKKPDPKYVKTKNNPDGKNIADLGITQFTVDLLSKAGINTIDELISLTYREASAILAREAAACMNKPYITVNGPMGEILYRLKERNLNFKFTKDMVRKIMIRDVNASFYTKSLLNSVMIYTIGDLLEYKKIDQLKKREGELHEIDTLIHDAKELLDKAVDDKA